MTQLYTSSYGRWPRRPERGLAPVVTSLTVPRWIAGADTWPALTQATPRWSYARKPGWEQAYWDQLNRIGRRPSPAGWPRLPAAASASPRSAWCCSAGAPTTTSATGACWLPSWPVRASGSRS